MLFVVVATSATPPRGTAASPDTLLLAKDTVKSSCPSPEKLDELKVGTMAKQWLDYDEPLLADRWLEYAEHYQAHFPATPLSKPMKMLEIGVQSGGSSRLWKQYYGADLTYVGMDIDPETVRAAKPSEDLFVLVGDQSNATRLGEICKAHGPFDMVIDDGGHTTELILASLEFLFPNDDCLTADGVYAIEDLHTIMSKDAVPDPRAVYDIAGRGHYGMHVHWKLSQSSFQWRDKPCVPEPTEAEALAAIKADPIAPVWSAKLAGMHLYDSMAFLHRGKTITHMTRVMRGADFLEPAHSAGGGIYAPHAPADSPGYSKEIADLEMKLEKAKKEVAEHSQKLSLLRSKERAR